MSNRSEKVRGLFLATIMVLSVMGGTIAFSGSVAAAGTASGVSEVTLNANAQPLGTSTTSFTLEENSNDFGSSGTANITLPDGVTWNEANSDLTVRQTSSGSISSVQFKNEKTLTFDYSGVDSSANGDVFSFGALYIDVNKSAGSSFTVDARVGVNSLTHTVNTNEPSISIGAGQSFGAGSNSNALADNDVTITTANSDGQIAAGSDLVIYANQSNGVTFDESLNVSADLTAAGTNSSKVDLENATLTGSMLSIPVDTAFDAADTFYINGLKVNMSADASAAQFKVEATPTNAKGTISSLSGNQISVTKPDATVSSPITLAVGMDG